MTPSGRAIVLLTLVAASAAAAPAERTLYTTWSAYAGSADSMQYSALSQITKGNVAALERVWFYPVPGEPDRLPFNPLIVDDVMYITQRPNDVVALDARTGRIFWIYRYAAAAEARVCCGAWPRSTQMK